METFDFLLIRKLCKSRNHLIRNYPSTVKEIRFFTTINQGFRFPPFLIWMGTWLYWIMGNFVTQPPRYLSKKTIQEEEKVVNIDQAAGGFEYSDAYLQDNDARFVYDFIRSALNSGCIAANYLESSGSQRDERGVWITKVKNNICGEEFEIRSKVVINATGPMADQCNNLLKQKTKHHLILSKGIHLMVEQISQSEKILAFFASDGRLFFVIPMGNKTCIGTTDTIVERETKKVTDEDRNFILKNINSLLNLPRPIEKKDIIAERCGVRPLVVEGTSGVGKDFMQLSRKHEVEVDLDRGFLTIFGGKLTDCLNVGDEISAVIKKMGIALPYPDYKWYGEPHQRVKEEFFHRAKLIDLDSYTSKESSEALSTRLWRRYGSEAFELLEDIQENPAQAEVLIKGTEYIRCELREAAKREMVTKLEDFLRRRSKIALTERMETIQNSKGLLEACQILFGEEAEAKMKEYFDTKEVE